MWLRLQAVTAAGDADLECVGVHALEAGALLVRDRHGAGGHHVDRLEHRLDQRPSLLRPARRDFSGGSQGCLRQCQKWGTTSAVSRGCNGPVAAGWSGDRISQRFPVLHYPQSLLYTEHVFCTRARTDTQIFTSQSDVVQKGCRRDCR